MQDGDAPEIEIETPSLGLMALVQQIGDDAKAFAKAEADWLKAEAGERAEIAKPAVIAILVGLGLIFGVTMAIPVGVMLLLAPHIGNGLAFLASVALFVIVAGGLFLFGSRRIKAAFRPRNDA